MLCLQQVLCAVRLLNVHQQCKSDVCLMTVDYATLIPTYVLHLPTVFIISFFLFFFPGYHSTLCTRKIISMQIKQKSMQWIVTVYALKGQSVYRIQRNNTLFNNLSPFLSVSSSLMKLLAHNQVHYIH